MDRAKRQLIKERTDKLLASDKSFKAVYKIIITDSERIFAQYTEGGEIIKVTFGEMDAEVRKYAWYIRTKTDIRHQFIGLDSENCVSWVSAFWGILMSGNKPFLVNCRHPEKIKKDMIKTIDAKLVIGAKVHDLGAEYVEFETIERETEDLGREEIEKGLKDIDGEFENEYALSSSATSLNETICVFKGQQAVISILNADYVLKNNKRIPRYYKGALRQLAFLPFYHIFGFSAVYMWFTFYGCTMVFLENYSGDTITRTVRKHGVTHIFAVPLLWQTMENRILKQVELRGEKTVKKFNKGLELSEKIQKIFPYAGEYFARFLLRDVTKKTLGNSIRFCVTGGAPIKDSTLRFFNCLGYPLHNGYGMTETGITSVCLEKNIKNRDKNSVGKPFPSVKYIIGEDGVLSVESAQLCDRRIINGVEVKTQGIIRTEDIFEKRERGYYVIGRENDIIIGADGENVNPDVLEKNFEVPFMQRYCIFKDFVDGKERPSLAVELRKYISPAQVKKTVEEVKRQSESLSPNFRPARTYFTYDLISPAEAVKISRAYLAKGVADGSIRLLTEKDLDLEEKETESFDETTELAKLVKKTVAEILGKKEEEILPDANVMTDLGGSSLDYFYIMTELSDKTGVTLFTDETHCPYTLREFCKEIEEQI